MTATVLKEFSWERMIAAVEAVRERACRASAALKLEGIPHVVVGGHAVASWVARVDKEAVRNTKDVDLMILRADLQREFRLTAGFSKDKTGTFLTREGIECRRARDHAGERIS